MVITDVYIKGMATEAQATPVIIPIITRKSQIADIFIDNRGTRLSLNMALLPSCW